VTARISSDNASVARVFGRVAEFLQAQGANPYRVRAYRQAAAAVASMDEPVVEVLAQRGRKALVALPTIGEGLAAAIEEIACDGRYRLLERLEGATAPEDLFASIPGIGEELAERIHENLDIETLEELEIAAHDGRLDAVPGFGPERIEAVRDHLAVLLNRSVRRRARERQLSLTEAGPAVEFDGVAEPLPRVRDLLALDADYRTLAGEHRLPKIAPRRFNPEGRRWLPVWHTDLEGYDLTIMFSNSARAHQQGKILDWVVIVFERDGQEEQCTVVTEFHGELAGRRVIRGREHECAEHYKRQHIAREVVDWAHRQAEQLADEAMPAPPRRTHVQREIERLHRFFEDWFNGDIPDDDAVFATVESALAPDFNLVSPGGKSLPRAVLLSQFRAAHGSRRGRLRIWIDDLHLHYQARGIIICGYREWQRQGNDTARGRRSTAVFEDHGDQLRWLHVHETWLPQG
jgi:DNA polymerase (family X)